jgi:hypothetical protein
MDTLTRLETLREALERSKPEDGYFWDDGKADVLREIDNSIEDLENKLDEILAPNARRYKRHGSK